MTADACVLCAAGTYQTGSGPPWLLISSSQSEHDPMTPVSWAVQAPRRRARAPSALLEPIRQNQVLYSSMARWITHAFRFLQSACPSCYQTSPARLRVFPTPFEFRQLALLKSQQRLACILVPLKSPADTKFGHLALLLVAANIVDNKSQQIFGIHLGSF